MKTLTALLLLLTSCLAHASPFEGWTDEEKAWFVASEVSQILDYQTTRNVLYQKPKWKNYYEVNPLLGRHPSQGKLNIAEVATIVGDYYFSDWLSHDNRLLWLRAHTIIELGITAHNLNIGAEIRF